MEDRITIIGIQTLFEGWGRYSNVTIDYRRLDGQVQRLEREIYDHGNAAAVLLFDPDRETVLLVRQFRYPPVLNGDPAQMLEVCAGMLDGETPALAASREALEETGHAPTAIRHICDVYMSPGSVTEKVSLFIAHYGDAARPSSGGGIAAEGEEIEIVELPLEQALALIDDGGIIDAKTVILLQRLALERAALR